MYFRRNILFSVVSALMCLALGAAPALAEVVDKVIVVVNDEVVTQREFGRVFEPIKESYAQHFEGEELQKRLEEARKGVLEQLINSKLAISLAKKEKIEIDEAELNSRLDKIKAYYPSEQAFLQALNEKGTNLTEFEKEIREQMLAQKLVEKEVASSIVITPGDIRDLYDKNKSQLVAPESVKARSITVRKKADSAKGADKKTMQGIVKDLRKGKDFAEMASEKSEGPYAERAGDMGYVVRGQTLKEIDEALFTTDKGKLSDIVETDLGYHVFLIEDKQESRPLELAEVSDFLRGQLYKKRFEESLVRWLDEKRKNAYIEYK